MAFDGITVRALTIELEARLTGGRISKISQTEKDELIITVKCAPERGGGQERLYMSADASLPLLYLADSNKPAPMTAPGFCMLLRKYLGSGRIRAVTQPGLERIVRFSIEHYNEMGDLQEVTLLIELMGKHSNIIFLDSDEKVIDSIKRIPASLSSVREVLPGRDYFIPQTVVKKDPLQVCAPYSTAPSAADAALCTRAYKDLLADILSRGGEVYRAIYGSFTGISPVIAQELCYRAGIDGDSQCASLSDEDVERLSGIFASFFTDVQAGIFTPTVYYENGIVREYAAVPLTIYENDAACSSQSFESMSLLLSDYYAEKNTVTRIHQKSADLRALVKTALERNVRKLTEQKKEYSDTDKRDKYRLWGELLTAYAYQLKNGMKEAVVEDYNTGNEVRIPMDETLSPSRNAKNYYDRYARMKRTAQALEVQMQETLETIQHLESVQTSLEIARNESDLMQIRQELIDSGIIKKGSGHDVYGKAHGGRGRKASGNTPVSQPLHYRSSDGFDIYVGKNNTQNDELTFQMASADDWWFHAKKIPGSHVVLVTGGREVPDRAFEEAGRLAAFYSGARSQGKAEVDYLKRRDVKKPAGSKPGFVVYYTNYSMVIDSDISGLKEV